MSAEKKNAAIVGVGVAACAVCCAGPILGILTAIGLGTAAGIALVGTFAILGGAAAVAFVIVRRRQRVGACAPTETPRAVPVELSDLGAPS
jgi:hypothetical protein